MQHMTKHYVSIMPVSENISIVQDLMRYFHLVFSLVVHLYVAAGLLMGQATWRQLLMAWKRLKKKSLSQTGCESINQFVVALLGHLAAKAGRAGLIIC